MEGTLNLYDEQRCVGTANDKAIASRLGGFKYNILNNGEKEEIYMRHLRNDDHYINIKGETTNKWFDRKRKYPRYCLGFSRLPLFEN